VATNSLRGILPVLLLSGCTVESWRPADLQLDIRGAELSDTDRVRICVDGHGMHEAALGAGSIAFTGLPTDTEVLVSVDALEEAEDTGSSEAYLRVGRAGPSSLSPDTPWIEAEWEACEDSCSPCQTPGDPVASGQNSSILAVRFID
jgi:hypothetical protein